MNFSSSESPLQTAQAIAGHQHYPASALYVVATPIGNLADLSLRALHVLHLMDAVACEDTRHTRPLLQHYGLDKPLLVLHEHNEARASQDVIARLQAGERIACVSDAGTPAISDPGARLVAACRQAQLRIVPIPGASSATCLLSAAGLSGDGRFVFWGFLPTKTKERKRALQQMAAETRASVLLEAPHRISALAESFQALGPRRLTIGRELTKQFEQIVTLPSDRFAAWLAQDVQHQRGEFTLVLHPGDSDSSQETSTTLRILMSELPLKQAVGLAARITGMPRNALYEQALKIQGA